MKKSLVLWMGCLSVFIITTFSYGIADDIPLPGNDSGMLYGYTPGPFIVTDSPTDLAIDGIGFFVIRDSGSVEQILYTKHGAFKFDSNGYLITSHGYIVRGWAVNENPLTGEIEEIGSITDIRIDAVDQSRISVDESGVIFQRDSSGTLVPLFRVALAKIPDPNKLAKLEDDVFEKTSASGDGITGAPGSNGLGTIQDHALEEIDPDFSYASDIWIDGEGYFIVRDPEHPVEFYYTPSGEFRFDKDNRMVSSEDFIVQGWSLETNPLTGEIEQIGSITNIRMDTLTMPPEETNSITVITNIDSNSSNHSPGSNALSLAWDGEIALDSHIAGTAYEHQATVKVYDALGSTHDITIFFDRAEITRTVEFIVTCSPEEDKRPIFDNPATDPGLGLLGRGLLTFSENGDLASMDFERYVGNSGSLTSNQGTWPSPVPTTGAFSGRISLPANYTFTATAGVVGDNAISITVGGDGDGTFTIPSSYAEGDYVIGPDGMIFQFNPGDVITEGSAFNVDIVAGSSGNLIDPNNWANMEGDFTNRHFAFSTQFIGSGYGSGQQSIGLDPGAGYDGVNWIPGTPVTTFTQQPSVTVSSTSNGYIEQDLVRVLIDQEGVITGYYSEGLVRPLFKAALATFQNENGLEETEPNLFKKTPASGSPTTLAPGVNGTGILSFNGQPKDDSYVLSCFISTIFDTAT